MERSNKCFAALIGAALLTVLSYSGGFCQNEQPAEAGAKMDINWNFDPVPALRKAIEEQGLRLPGPEEKRVLGRAQAHDSVVAVMDRQTQDDYYQACLRNCSTLIRTDRCLRWERDSYEPGFPPSWTCMEWEIALDTPDWCTETCNRITPGPACRPFGKKCSSNKQCCSKSCSAGTCDM